MTGIEKITGRITADAEAEAQGVLAEAETQANAITARYQAEAERVGREARAKGEAAAADREEHLASAAGMQARQLLLSTRQELLDAAFDRALEKLCTLPEQQAILLLVRLAVSASTTGKEQLQLNAADSAAYGERVVTAANATLGERGQLTLSPTPGTFQGGLVLSDGAVDVNCTYETLVRLARGRMAGDVAKVLFDGSPS